MALGQEALELSVDLGVRRERGVVRAVHDVAHVKGQVAGRVAVLAGGARQLHEQITEPLAEGAAVCCSIACSDAPFSSLESSAQRRSCRPRTGRTRAAFCP